MTNNKDIDNLLKEKENLKTQIKFSKNNIKVQKKVIETQKERAEKGQKNTLAFEQRELPKKELNLVRLKEQLKDIKNDISKYKIVNVANQYLIDTKFIDQLRLNWSNKYFMFENIDNIEIVPDKLTHSYLLSNFNISQSISDYYYSNSKGLMSDAEYQKIIKRGYRGEKERYLIPYSININGGFYTLSDLHCKLTGAIYFNKCIKGHKIKYLSDLTPYFKDYNLGFKKGFDNFEIDCVKPYLMELSDKKDFINKVFEYLTKEILFKHSWSNGTQGFTTNNSLGKKPEIVKGIDDGKKQGYFYKAWTIVFSNSALFEPMFNAIINKPQQKDKNTYSLKAVAIAYFCLGITINEDNYKEILKKHTKFKSNKILQKTIVRTSQVTSLSEDKTADKKHLNALNDAERLLSGMKNDKATKSIKQFISTFESKFNDFYN